jgi:hypothetical protein
MNRMAGTIIMAIGLLTFIFGVLVYLNANRRKTDSLNLGENEIIYEGREENVNPVMKVVENQVKTEIVNQPDLGKVIEMAIADGVLTENEKKVLKQLAIEQELDYNEIISDVERQLLLSGADSETAIIDYLKKNGDDFEKFIVQKFSKRFFTIKEWAGDKYVNGIYAVTTQQPDLLIEFQMGNQRSSFSVECKWRKRFYNSEIEFATQEQFDRYKNFQESMQIPVYVAIGIGGKGGAPEHLYLVPLNSLDGTIIHFNKIRKYKKPLDKDFFFDPEKKELR